MSDYIMHYGVKGMKWGQHLFGKDYTIGGKSYSKKEVRADNKKAFEYGRNATITGRAKVIADRKKEKAKNRMDRNPDSTRLKNKYREASKIAYNLTKEYNADHDRAKQHVKELKRKYGGDNVKDLVYKKFGKRYVVNEPIHDISEYADIYSAENMFNYALAAVGGAPVVTVTSPNPYATKRSTGQGKYMMARHRIGYKNRSAHANNDALLVRQNHMREMQAMDDFMGW